MESGQDNHGNLRPSQSDGSSAGSATSTPAVQKRSGWRIFWGIFTAFSVMGNIILLLMIIGMGVMLAGTFGGLTGSEEDSRFTERVVQSGSRMQKIAVINIQGIIQNETADTVTRQVKMAGKDTTVKAVIVRIDSPGGTVSASDRINYELGKLKTEYHKPVVAFMEGIAASGGYYSAVACEKIVAEPTVITGSIGVIMETFVVQGLLEEKLGVKAVVLKSGEKKDWPNPFRPVTAEQEKYLQDKLITPAYDRFVKVVAAGRTMLSEEQVRILADGSIYGAQESLAYKLIDEIGYFDKAVEAAKTLGKAKDAEVVEYRKVFSWATLLDTKSGVTMPSISRSTLTEFTQPQLLYLWKGNQ